MRIEQLVPVETTVELGHVLDELAQPPTLEPFASPILEFIGALSQALLRDPEARTYPELVALGYWMRPAALQTLAREFAQRHRPHSFRAPRGVVFHIPPANVDTIFVYSWLLAVLCGNHNIVRLSRRASPQTALLTRLLCAALATAPPALSRSTIMLRYGHEEEVNAAISGRCDVRVIWGGDQTVNLIRRIPLPPHAKELTFPDRLSYGVIDASRYLELDEPARAALAHSFYNDTFWFDQMACSSPRLLFFTGPRSAAEQAAPRFYEALAASPKAREHQEQPATHIQKFTAGCVALLEGQASRYHEYQPLVVLDRIPGTPLPAHPAGGGLIFSQHLDSLDDLIPFVERRHQTLLQFGFTPDEILSFTRGLYGRGLDRIVPFGQALDFHRLWDGYDLLEELIRYVHLPA